MSEFLHSSSIVHGLLVLFKEIANKLKKSRFSLLWSGFWLLAPGISILKAMNNIQLNAVCLHIGVFILVNSQSRCKMRDLLQDLSFAMRAHGIQYQQFQAHLSSILVCYRTKTIRRYSHVLKFVVINCHARKEFWYTDNYAWINIGTPHWLEHKPSLTLLHKSCLLKFAQKT